MTALGEKALPGHIGIEFVDCGDDWIKARMPVNERTQQPFQRLHGGASVALAETVGSVAASWCVDNTKFVGVGMEINANHIRSAREGHVRGVCRALHTGSRHQVWQIEIFDEQGRLCCTSRLTTAIL